MILFEERAATVLYNVLSTIGFTKKFLLPLNVCPIVPDTFIRANVKFEFIDISLDTLCMDEELILEKIKNDKEIGGILFVYTFGIKRDMQPFYKKIKEINSAIFIIDDMCPSIQKFDYDINNSYADMALFSSGYSKYVDIGFGGYGFLKNSVYSATFKDKSQTKEFLEYKEKILEQIPLMKAHKEKLNNIYRIHIPQKYHLGEKFNNWRFSIMVDNKEEILKKIFEVEGLFASSHYPQVDYNYVEHPIQNSNAAKVHVKILNLFNDFRFDQAKALAVAQIVKQNLPKE